MGRRSGWALPLMLALTLAVWLLQLAASKVCGSLTLLSRSFHTFSALLGLGTLQASLRLNAGGRAPAGARNTFGWLRVEPLGALVQAVFLAGVCFAVLGKAVESVLQPHPVRRPGVLLGVGLTSLLVDLGALYLFRRGSTPQDWPSAGKRRPQENQDLLSETATRGLGESQSWQGEDLREPGEEGRLGWQAASPHVLGDALGSVLVLLSALAHYAAWLACPREQCDGEGEVRAGPCWLLRLDPALCLGVVCKALWAACPRLRESGLILLQAVPGGLDVDRLRERLLRVEGVVAVHELHVWRLAGRQLVATAHVRCREAGAAGRAGAFFRREGFQAATVQPELGRAAGRGLGCALACEESCASRLCCSGDGVGRRARENSMLADAPLSGGLNISRRPRFPRPDGTLQAAPSTSSDREGHRRTLKRNAHKTLEEVSRKRPFVTNKQPPFRAETLLWDCGGGGKMPGILYASTYVR
ncbi:proton-coupled zinc antiporter SLC30A1-like [Mobula hypostoma]|uniref:proton-coupled zinc antiporter SLC30A1-like n=1 Tax=Mobula hypostoma TaxID=723540 RepID=UPI002FC35B00